MADAEKLRIGMPFQFSGSGPSFGSALVLNSSDISFLQYFTLETAEPVTRIGFRKPASTGTSPTWRGSLQGYANGAHDGSIKSGGNAYVDFTSGALTSNQITWLNLTSPYQGTIGEDLAILCAYQSGTIGASNNVSISMQFAASSVISNGFPGYATGNAGVYSKSANAPVFGYGTADKVFGFPISSLVTQNINSGATPEAGVRFTIPSYLGTSARLNAVRFPMGTRIGGCSVTCSLYSGGGASDTTVVTSKARDTDDLITTGAWARFVLPSPPDLPTGPSNFYRISLQTADASNQGMLGIGMGVAADFSAFPYGANFLKTTRSGGSWTDSTTERMFIELEFSEVTPAAGGGGGRNYILPM